jgi:hypothetical protein
VSRAASRLVRLACVGRVAKPNAHPHRHPPVGVPVGSSCGVPFVVVAPNGTSGHGGADGPEPLRTRHRQPGHPAPVRVGVRGRGGRQASGSGTTSGNLRFRRAPCYGILRFWAGRHAGKCWYSASGSGHAQSQGQHPRFTATGNHVKPCLPTGAPCCQMLAFVGISAGRAYSGLLRFWRADMLGNVMVRRAVPN